MISLVREDWTISLPTSMWAEMLRLLGTCGWRPSVPSMSFLADQFTVTEADAAHLAAAGQIVLEAMLNDPMGAAQSIRFDLGKFAEVVTFAAEGAFLICSA